MSKHEKLLKRLLSNPKNFKYSKLEILLKNFGYNDVKKGKTSGSRRAFISKENQHIIRLHKPHPKEILKNYQIKYIIEELKKEELI